MDKFWKVFKTPQPTLSFPAPKIASGSAKTEGGRNAASRPRISARYPTPPTPTYGNRGNINVIETAAISTNNLRCPAHLSDMKPVNGVASDPATGKLASKSDEPPENP